MYGTIVNMKIKTGHEQQISRILDAEPADGAIAWFVMKPDEQDAELVGVVIFESKEAYLANANNPSQHQTFLKLMDHLVSEPTWTDGEFLLSKIV